MKTCIYYELDEVSEEDVRKARAMAGSGAVEIVPVGTLWPTAMGDSLPERAVSHRDPRFLETVMAWVDRLGKSLEQHVPEVAWRHGVSLAESARFDLLFSTAEAIQRWAVLAMIRERWKPDRIIWYTARPRPDRDLSALVRAAGTQIQVRRTTPFLRSVWNAARDSLKLRLGPPIKRVLRIVQAALRPPRWPKQRCDTVFTDYFPNNIHALMPVARCLEAEHGICVRWLAGRKKVADALAAQGVDCLELAESLSAAAHWRGRLNGSQRRSLEKTLRRLPNELLVWKDGAGNRDYFLAVLNRHLAAAWDENAHWIEFYTEAWRALRPAVVVSATYSNGMGRAAAMTAKLQGARAAYLQHGMFPAFAVYAWFCQDLLMMWGEWNRRNLVSYGVDERLISVTGATIYDSMLAEASREASPPIPRPGEPYKISYMASRTAGAVVTYAEARATLLTVAGAVRRIPGGRLTVKIHPGDNTGMVTEVLRDFPDFVAVQKGSARDVIAESDAVIVVSSTTGLEACAADKPLMVLNVTDSLVTVPYVEYGAALYVSPEAGDAAAELERTLLNLQQDPAMAASLAKGRRALLDDLLNGGKGDAAQEAAAAIARLLGQRPTNAATSNSEPAPSRAI